MANDMIETNIGLISVEDYLEIIAQQYGYSSYEELRADGLIIDLDEV